MFHICYGPSPSFSSDDLPADALRLIPDPDLLAAWWLPRAVLAALQTVVPAAEIEAALVPERGLLSLVLPGLEPTPAEQAQARHHAATPIGFMTHNAFLIGYLQLAWARALAPLVARRTLVVAVPGFDADGFAVLHRLAVLLPPADRPTIRVEVDLSAFAGPRSLWSRDAEWVGSALAALEGLDDTRVERRATPAAEAPRPAQPVFHPLDGGREHAAHAALAAGAPDAVAVGIAALRAAFAAYGFTAALRLGLQLLDHPLEPDEAREVHWLVGLSAYNRQVRRSDQVDALPELLERSFVAAAEGETDPAKLSHLYYRLAINTGRRRGALDLAVEQGTQAIEFARDSRVPRGLGAFLEAWARNGRAFSHAAAGRGREAMQDCEAAWRLLDEAEAGEGAPAVELLPTRAVLADNLARVALLRRDAEAAAHWQRHLEAAEEAIGATSRGLSADRWLALLRTQRDLSHAAERAERALHRARAALEPTRIDQFAAELAELSYRRGDAHAAARLYGESLRIRRRVGAPEDVRATRMSRLMALLRTGELAEADAELRDLQQEREWANPAAQAQLHALAARLTHAGGSDPEACVEAAIDAAVESGDRDVLLHVARVAGELAFARGDLEMASDVWQRGLEIAAAPLGPDAPPPPPGELLAIHLGRWHLEPGPERARAVLDHAEAALDDSEVWWRVPELVQLAASAPHHPGAQAVQRAHAERLPGLQGA